MFNWCAWIPDADGVFETTCKHLFEFNDGGPEDNGFKFCPYCGKMLLEEEPAL